MIVTRIIPQRFWLRRSHSSHFFSLSAFGTAVVYDGVTRKFTTFFGVLTPREVTTIISLGRASASFLIRSTAPLLWGGLSALPSPLLGSIPHFHDPWRHVEHDRF